MKCFDAFRNPNGTVNGVDAFSAVTGLSGAEIRWTFERLKHLLHVEKRTKEGAKRIVSEEAKSTPWLSE